MYNNQTAYGLDMDLNKVCRICLSQTNESVKLFSIFSSAIVDGFLVSIPEVIMFCVDLQVAQKYGLPDKICQSCKTQLLNFYVFKQKCKRTEQVLQQAVFKSYDNDQLSSSAVPDATEDIEPSSVTPEEIIEILDEHHCDALVEETTDAFHSPGETEDELKQPTTSILLDLDCADVGSTEEITVVFEKPQSIKDSPDGECIDSVEFKPSVVMPGSEEDQMDNANMEELESIEQFSNDHFSKPNIEDTGMPSVKKTEHSEDAPSPDQLTCNICGKTVIGRSRYFRHMRSHDANANITEYFTYHVCSVCRIAYLQKDDLIEHITANDHQQSMEHPNIDVKSPYVCGICSVEHDNVVHIKQHLLSHLENFQCPFDGCGCEYTSVVRLGIHINNKHIEYESHTCRYCGLDSFESMAELQQHLRIKCSGKKFLCTHCDKKFLTSRSLAQHMKCLGKKHQCDECGKAFAQPGELKLHQRIHNGERPFQCTVCGKRYKTASLRTSHMDSHIEGKTFQCQLCGKRLQSRTCYRNHIRRHSEEKKHGCDICSKKFYTKYNVKIHKEKVHKLNQNCKSENI